MQFKLPLRVRYAETDQMGIVYHANYLTWFEVARTEFIRHLGLSYRQIEAQGVLLPIVEANCRYVRPALYDDELFIELEVKELGAASLIIEYNVFRAPDELLAQGWTRQAFVDSAMRPVNAKRQCPTIWRALAETIKA